METDSIKIKKGLRKGFPVLLTILFCIISVISLTTIIDMQGNARIINYTGIVRGATQRLVKQEMNGSPNDELIQQLDGIMMGLSSGNKETGLTALPDTAYQALIGEMGRDWGEIKHEIEQVRRETDNRRLYELSESYFDLANRAVSAAEQYSENQVRSAKRILICLNLCFVLLAALFWLYGRRQKKVQLALDLAEHASLAKSEFLSRMSHEIRTPLNGIIGMTDIAKLNPTDRNRMEDCLNKIGLSSRYLLALINDILDMSRIESGKVQLEQRAFDLRDIFDQIEGMFQQKAEDVGVDFHTECDELRVSTVMGDDVRLSQILVNLVSNALKFTPSGGRVTLTVHEKEIGEQGIQLEFVVEDTGIGISEDFQKRIFEPFEQETTSNLQYGGTGLGLAISSNFVKMMGGEISLNSKLGEGSRFVVCLTLQHTSDRENEVGENETKNDRTENANDEAGFDLTGTRVLLAEDNEINAEIVTVILETNGADVKLARNGMEALELFTNSSEDAFTLILMDIQMPVMDGLEASRRIRGAKAPNAKTIPIIGLSANAFSEDIDKALKNGMNGYLSKPIDMEKLLKTVLRFQQ